MAWTIQDVIDIILKQIPGAPLKLTVDTVKSGDSSQPVTGIVTTFLATYDVLTTAADLGANLVITHEPTFYNHLDEVDWLSDDPVYRAKRGLIQEQEIVVWRFHDHWHKHCPDGILSGVVNALGWQSHVDLDTATATLPPTPLDELAATFQDKLDTGTVRLIGDPGMLCRTVVLALGASGGRHHIHRLAQEGIDVLACGELNEWETSEYVRDAIAQGQNKALIVLGHAASEEAGMRWLVDWLRPLVPGVPIAHVPAGNPFRSV